MAAGYEAVYLRLATTEPEPPAASADKQGAAAAKDLQPVDVSACVLGVPAPRLRSPALAITDQEAATRTSRSWRRR
jgi:hypothetical protein